MAQFGGDIGIFQQFMGAAQQAGGRSVLLQTAALAAAAAAALAVFDLDMADLPAGAMDSGQQVALHNHAAAHTGTQGDKHHILTALASSLAHLAQCRGIGVIEDLDRQLTQGTELFRHVKAAPLIQIDAGLDIAVVEHRPRHSHAYPRHFIGYDTLFRHLAQQRQGNVGQQVFAVVFTAGRDLPFLQQTAGTIKQPQLNRGPSQINSKRVFFHGLLLS